MVYVWRRYLFPPGVLRRFCFPETIEAWRSGKYEHDPTDDTYGYYEDSKKTSKKTKTEDELGGKSHLDPKDDKWKHLGTEMLGADPSAGIGFKGNTNATDDEPPWQSWSSWQQAASHMKPQDGGSVASTHSWESHSYHDGTQDADSAAASSAVDNTWGSWGGDWGGTWPARPAVSPSEGDKESEPATPASKRTARIADRGRQPETHRDRQRGADKQNNGA